MIIDTDAGVDDVQAIMMALHHADTEVVAITCVTGNTHVDWVTQNVFAVLDIVGAGEIPVFRGAEQPLLPGTWEGEARVHGEDGLGNYAKRQPTARQLQPEAAAVALVRLANDAPGELTLVTLGPLTNVALACRLDPEFPQKIARFVFMGGAELAMGNTRNLSAEFNVYCDPEAAAVVLDAFAEAEMLSWEATVRHPFTWEQYETLAAGTSRAAEFFRDTTGGTVKFLRELLHAPGFFIPDPLAMAAALEPQLVQESSFHYVTVETHGTLTRGQTVVDHFGASGRAPNVHIIKAMDIAAVYAMFERMLG